MEGRGREKSRKIGRHRKNSTKKEIILTCARTGDSEAIRGRVFSGVAFAALPDELHFEIGSTFSFVLSDAFSLFKRAAIAPT